MASPSKSPPSNSVKGGRPLTPEQARKGYSACRFVAIIAIGVMWIYIVTSALALHGVKPLPVVIAVAYTLAVPWFLRYVKLDFQRRAGVPDVSK